MVRDRPLDEPEEDLETAVGRVLRGLRPGDAVTVKGSNGSRTGRIVAALKSRFAATAS